MLAATTLKRLWKNEYFKTAIMIILIIVVVFGFWYGSKTVLNTQYPALAVASGSMGRLPGPRCDGWTHPFEPTLHVGDLIIIQGANSEEIKAAPYPDGDIIVFHRLSASGELIVHRAISKEERNGTWYFQTQGDGNSGPDSQTPNIPEDNVVGKVIMRIPWIGHIALLMNNSSGIFIIAFLLIILVIVEFIVPVLSGRKGEVEQRETSEETLE